MLKVLQMAGFAFALFNTAQASAAQSAVYLLAPQNGATVKSPVTVVFGLHNPWGVAPAGTKIDKTGHHHLLIDVELPDLGKPIAKDASHLHFGGGQTETELKLTPGPHTLQLLFGDFAHVPHNPPQYSEKISITVE